MNIPFVAAGSLLLLAFFVHTFMGDREYRALKPGRRHTSQHFSYWLTGRSVFHMASMDLLLGGGWLFATGVGMLTYSPPLATFLCLLYGAYLCAWLASLYLSGASTSDYLKQGQWILFLLVAALVAAGMWIQNTTQQ